MFTKTLLAATAAFSFASMGHAATINFDYADGSDSSNGADLGTSATLDVTFEDVGGDVKLSVTATNTSDVTTGGYLTAFGFVLPDISGVISTMMDAAYSISEFSGTQTLNNFSIDLNVGAGTGGDYEGGGKPAGGIGLGEDGSYMFVLDTALTASELESAFFATDPNSAVRFQGLIGGGSDKLTNGGGVSEVPLPASAVLLLAGLAGLRVASRKKSA